MLRSLVASIALRTGRLVGLYRRICRPDGYQWAAWLAPMNWLGGRDSNPDSMVQSHLSYRWTTSQQRTERRV